MAKEEKGEARQIPSQRCARRAKEPFRFTSRSANRQNKLLHFPFVFAALIIFHSARHVDRVGSHFSHRFRHVGWGQSAGDNDRLGKLYALQKGPIERFARSAKGVLGHDPGTETGFAGGLELT